ncbi:hypothetical protein D3C85_1229180 [compost metagenome]
MPWQQRWVIAQRTVRRLGADFFIYIDVGVSGENHVARRHLVGSQSAMSAAGRHAVLLRGRIEPVVLPIGTEGRSDSHHHLVTFGQATFQKRGRQPLLADDRYTHALSPRKRKP